MKKIKFQVSKESKIKQALNEIGMDIYLEIKFDFNYYLILYKNY